TILPPLIAIRVTRRRACVGLAALLCILTHSTTEAIAGEAKHDGRIDALVDLIAHDPAFKVRASATQRLAGLTNLSSDDQRIVTRVLIEALSDKSEIVRGMAAHSIGKRNIKEARVWLEQLRDKDDNEFVRKAASDAIKALAAQEASVQRAPAPAKKK